MVISDFSDLMADGANQYIENGISRITRLTQISGVQLIISTQNPSANTLTEKIKSSIINRVAFTTFTEADSNTVIGRAGAEKLLGRGDMLYWNTGNTFLARIQGALVTQSEIARLVNFWHVQVN